MQPANRIPILNRYLFGFSLHGAEHTLFTLLCFSLVRSSRRLQSLLISHLRPNMFMYIFSTFFYFFGQRDARDARETVVISTEFHILKWDKMI